jgi:hypothetical protein
MLYCRGRALGDEERGEIFRLYEPSSPAVPRSRLPYRPFAACLRHTHLWAHFTSTDIADKPPSGSSCGPARSKSACRGLGKGIGLISILRAKNAELGQEAPLRATGGPSTAAATCPGSNGGVLTAGRVELSAWRTKIISLGLGWEWPLGTRGVKRILIFDRTSAQRTDEIEQ